MTLAAKRTFNLTTLSRAYDGACLERSLSSLNGSTIRYRSTRDCDKHFSHSASHPADCSNSRLWRSTRGCLRAYSTKWRKALKIEELKITYYHEALALAQRALISGLIVCAVAYAMVISGEGKESYIIPFFNIELSSKRTYTGSLLLLFFMLGLLCKYGVEKANNIRRSISDQELAIFLLEAPNIFHTKLFIRSILYGALFGACTGLISNLFKLEHVWLVVTGSIITAPYFIALYSDNPHKYKI